LALDENESNRTGLIKKLFYMNKNFNLNDVGIVIQGPTNNYKDILSNIDKDFSYVWSTWQDEPIENIKEISKEIPILLNDKPEFSGFKNINMQCASTEAGIRAIKKPWIIKVRGDLLWINQKNLIETVFNKMIEENSWCSYLNYKPDVQEMHDFITFSSYDYALDLWSYRQDRDNFNSPETQLCHHIMNKFSLSYEEMVNKMSFINILLEKGILDIYCVKYKCFMSENANFPNGIGEPFPRK
jgi:hypothetical protein